MALRLLRPALLKALAWCTCSSQPTLNAWCFHSACHSGTLSPPSIAVLLWLLSLTPPTPRCTHPLRHCDHVLVSHLYRRSPIFASFTVGDPADFWMWPFPNASQKCYGSSNVWSANILNRCTFADETGRPGQVDYTSFRYITAVKQPWAWSVLGLETARKARRNGRGTEVSACPSRRTVLSQEPHNVHINILTRFGSPGHQQGDQAV